MNLPNGFEIDSELLVEGCKGNIGGSRIGSWNADTSQVTTCR
jgi:hypothetical protein